MTTGRPRGESAVRATIIGVGVLALGWGLWLMTQQSLSDLLSAGAWFVIPAVLSDLLLLPIVAIVGAALTRHLQPWIRLPAQVALAMIGSLTFIALPFLTGLGKQPDNPSSAEPQLPAWARGLHPAHPGRDRRLGALFAAEHVRSGPGPAAPQHPAAETTW